MFTKTTGTACFLAAAAGMWAIAAAAPSIGIAISNGNIKINDAMTAGNANVYNGTLLETDRTADVRMTGGADAHFGTSSAARLFSDHVELRQGSARVSGLSVNASGLRITPEAHGSANVAMTGKVVQIAAVTGNVRVFNADGVAVANLLPGRALNMTPQDAGASAPTTLTGCAVRNGDVVTLTDQTTNVTVQLRGGNVRAGRHVTVTGTTVTNATPAGGATQVIAVTSVKTAPGGCGATGAAAAAGAAGGAAAGTAVTSTAVIAGVAAVAVAATVGIVVSAATASSTPSGTGNCPGVSPCTF